MPVFDCKVIQTVRKVFVAYRSLRQYALNCNNAFLRVRKSFVDVLNSRSEQTQTAMNEFRSDRPLHECVNKGLCFFLLLIKFFVRVGVSVGKFLFGKRSFDFRLFDFFFLHKDFARCFCALYFFAVEFFLFLTMPCDFLCRLCLLLR